MTPLRMLAFLALMGVSSCQTSDCSYYTLLDHLSQVTSDELLQITRPVKNWTRTTAVQVEMTIFAILGVDEKFQTVTLQVSIDKFWENEFLKWDSSNYCGIDVVTIPSSMLWIPDIVIQEDTSDTGSLQESSYATLDPRGLVHVTAQQRLTYTCQLNLYRFPFDVQNCEITFTSVTADANYIKLIEVKNDTTFPMRTEVFTRTQGEWKLLNIKTKAITFNLNNSPKSQLVYMVLLQRKPFLYIINLILPMLFLLVLDLASFLVNEARGEKLGFKVTILLSIFVLLLILQNILPSTEENMPIIAIYCLSVFTLVWISVLEAMLISFITDLDDYCGQESRASDTGADIELVVNGPNDPAGENQVSPERRDLPADQLGDIIPDEEKTHPQEPKRGEKNKRKATCYKQLAKILDSIFFVLYFFTVVGLQIWTFVTWMQDIRAHGA